MEEQPSDIWWTPFSPLEICPIRHLIPKCIRGVKASEVTIYPNSGLISVDNQHLFMCRAPLYPLLLFTPAGLGPKTEKELWYEVLSHATHVGLSHDEEELQIFFTMFGDLFEINETQPFGLWATLRPNPYQRSIFRPLYAIVARKKQQKEKALAWAAAGHCRLGNQISIKSLQIVAENIDLMRLIILAVVTTY